MTIGTAANVDQTTTIIDSSEKESFKIKYPKIFGNSGVQGYKIFLDRYTLKAPKGVLDVGDLVLVITNKDPKWPQKEIGFIRSVLHDTKHAEVWLGDGESIEVHFDLISQKVDRTLFVIEDISVLEDKLSSISGAGVRAIVELALQTKAEEHLSQVEALYDLSEISVTEAMSLINCYGTSLKKDIDSYHIDTIIRYCRDLKPNYCVQKKYLFCKFRQKLNYI